MIDETTTENGNDGLNQDASPIFDASLPSTDSSLDMESQHRFECMSCGYVYDPAEGLKKLGIERGTAFKDIDPGVFRCPVCLSRTDAFTDIGIRSKPSGFEENLKYGFANNLTPGQKNILIFGGLAFFFACFLSLYALR